MVVLSLRSAVSSAERSENPTLRKAQSMAPAWIEKHWTALAVTAIVAVTAVVIRLEGRLWFCECGELRVVVAEARSPNTSQHLFDPYSLTHVQHGFVFYWFLVCL